MTTYTAIALFGLCGIFCRYGLDQVFKSSSFPLSTFIINISGSFLAGCLYVLAERQNFSEGLRAGLLVGLCGGFTTFSAFSLQSVQLIEKGRFITAALYMSTTTTLGFLAALAPVLLFKKI
jgi:fluoride exporter